MQSQSIKDPSTPFIVSLAELNAGVGREGDLGFNSFSSHKDLERAVPGDLIGMAWLTVPKGQTLPVRIHGQASLLIVLEGKGELVGQTIRTIERGDVVTLPGGHEYGVTQVEGDGIRALQVLFEDEVFDRDTLSNAEAREESPATTLEQLLAKNEKLAGEVLRNPYFLMIGKGGLGTERVRSLFRDRLRVFCDAFQTFLFTRQATCDDQSYRGVFLEHLLEEVGHNDLMKITGENRRFDAVLEATSNWFCHQMFLQDNAGKAAIHLVLETGGDYFHNLAKPSFEGDVSEEYFRTHAEDDARHKEMSVELLRGQTPKTYQRLHETVVDAWKMIDAMTRRIHRLVELESSAS